MFGYVQVYILNNLELLLVLVFSCSANSSPIVIATPYSLLCNAYVYIEANFDNYILLWHALFCSFHSCCSRAGGFLPCCRPCAWYPPFSSLFFSGLLVDFGTLRSPWLYHQVYLGSEFAKPLSINYVLISPRQRLHTNYYNIQNRTSLSKPFMKCLCL